MFTNPIVKKVLEHGTAIVIFLLVSLFYFYPQLQGKVVQQTDIVQFKSMSNEITTFMEETGEESVFEISDLRRLMEVNFCFAENLARLAAQKAVALEQRSVAITVQTAQAAKRCRQCRAHAQGGHQSP